MKIALINENSQKKKNNFILNVLEKVAEKYGHQVFNYGASEGKDANINYVGAGLLAGILLNSHAVDFVIMGCSSGEGVLISANAMPNVYCGYVSDVVDAKLFAKINAGNAVSIPFGKYFGVGTEFQLESIFETLFTTPFGEGYPSERREIQEEQRKELELLKQTSQINMREILEEIDKDFLYQIIHNEYFEENFLANSLDDEISGLLKDLFDAWV
mgnify:CR=1 FL=1